MQIELSPELKAAADHLRQAAEAAGQRVVGSPTAHHLRQAARHALQAGINGLDDLERRAAGPAKPAADGGCCSGNCGCAGGAGTPT